MTLHDSIKKCPFSKFHGSTRFSCKHKSNPLIVIEYDFQDENDARQCLICDDVGGILMMIISRREMTINDTEFDEYFEELQNEDLLKTCIDFRSTCYSIVFPEYSDIWLPELILTKVMKE